ncbi:MULTISPECIES: ABC transporter substrate-binding protein [Arthrobacter]|uniref:ABC transporter substrate-binding protein n=2 Tax=Arthrobacter TaxID=1663 RepID=A0ABU9KLC2_9MICC|nr:ABC transporter substrate-binding protein [Arthrobacter sp. YJM1]MDP5226300.1 ABC transporter substrate-binding protein [Arthrobacter sp. YJM1]
MSRLKTLATGTALVAALIGLSACGNTEGTKAADGAAATVSIQTNNGAMDVKTKPARIAALDNTSFATLKAFGVQPVAVAKPLLPKDGYQDWASNADIKDAGSHREPKFENISEAQPDLIIGGYRFASHTEKLSKIAPVVDIAPSDKDGASYLDGLKKQTLALGDILDKKETAQKIVADLDSAIADAKKATHGETVFLANSSGGTIDNGAGRIGTLLDGVNLKDVFAQDDGKLKSDSVHNNSGLSPETVAAAKPEWMIVMDRDAAVTEAGKEYKPAKSVIEGLGNVWKDTPFFAKNQIVHLPADFYLTEGIQAYTSVFKDIATAFNGASSNGAAK